MFGILLAGVGDHLGTLLRRAVAKIEKLFLVSDSSIFRQNIIENLINNVDEQIKQ